ncbi:hypothetical protein [Pseudomonas xionganensis]|uniref:Uncharacterized protein n=1 Tax=Pseudomonas xionganensis TaxID=2654845 RepID=A0A6I4L1X2_9PSED|nr:hypothetical protein [Pseudomonas xionganensis]MVW76736.1 hypothetical protein [Pseudomonas xionganensis]
MKKFILAAAGVCALVGSGAASAIDLGGGTNEILMTDCTLLANDINLIVSNNVVGAVICDAGTGFAAVSLCHTNGQTNSRSAVVTADADGNTTCTITADEDCVETVEGSLFPSASSRFGTVSGQFPGAACAVAAATGIATTQAANAD